MLPAFITRSFDARLALLIMIAMVNVIVVQDTAGAALVSDGAAPLTLRAAVTMTRAGRARGTERRPSAGDSRRSVHAPAEGGDLIKASRTEKANRREAAMGTGAPKIVDRLAG